MKIRIRNLKQHKHKNVDYLYTAKVTYRNIHISNAMYDANSGGIKIDIIHKELTNKINEFCNNSFDDYVKTEIIKKIIELDKKKFDKDSKQNILYGNPNEKKYKLVPLNKPVAMYTHFELKEIVHAVKNMICKPNEVILNKNIKIK